MSSYEKSTKDDASFYRQNLVLHEQQQQQMHDIIEKFDGKRSNRIVVINKPKGKLKTKQKNSKNTKNDDYNESGKSVQSDDGKKGDEDNVPAVPFFHLFKYATKRNRLMYLLGIISAICTGLTVPANSLLLGNLVNAMVVSSADTNHEMPDLNGNETFMGAVEAFSIQSTILGVIMLACSYISVTLFNYAAQDQILYIRGIFFQSIIFQDMSWFDMNQSGAIASRMNEDLTKMEEGMGEKVVMFLHFMIAFLGSIILAFIKGWQLALVCLSSLPVTFISMGFISLSTSKLAKQESSIYAAAGNIAQEALSAIRTVKAFEGEYKEVNAYKDQIIGARNLNIKRNLFSGLGFALLWFFIYSSYGLAFWFGTGLVLKNYANNEYYSNYDAGTMITVFFAVMMGSMNIGLASPYIEAFGIAKGACAKTFKLIEQQPVINSIEKRGLDITEPLNQLVFRNVKFAYPTRPEVIVLNKLNIQIDHGQTIALVGSSGCGKSTCIQLIQRFYDPSDGDILFNGVNIKELDITCLRQRIGVVGQEPVLFGISIYENIRYGYKDASEEEVVAAARVANALEFINQLPKGFDTLVGERGAQLSGGEKQRIAIARALIRNPEILLLDEATSALDAESERIVQDALQIASQGRTTIIVAHRLSTVRRANRIIVLDKGQMIESGTHDELMALKQSYFNLVLSQLTIEETNASTMITSAKLKKNLHQEYLHLSDNNLSWMQHNKVATSKQEDEVDQHEVDIKQFSIWPILKLNINEWPYILCGSISAIVTGTAMPLFALLFGNMMEVFTEHTDPDYIRSNTNTYSLYFVLCGIVVGVGTFFQIYTFGVAGEKLTERIRGLMFECMLQMEVAWFDDRSNGTGTLCSRLSSDAAAIQGATGQRIGTVMQSLSTMCLGIALAMYYQWSLGLVALLFTPFIFTAMYYQRKIMAEENMGTGKIMEKCTKLSVEVVSNIRTVMSLGLENMFYKQYMEMLTPAVKKAKRNTHFRGLVFGSGRALMFFAYATCMYYGSWLVLNGKLSFGDVFKVAQAVIMGSTTIANAMAFAPNFQKGLTAAQRIYQLIRREPKIIDRVADTPPLTPWHTLSDVDYNNVKFSYPTRPNIVILQDLNIKIKGGQKVALVGASGCGKSTCTQLIQRFYDVDDGSITINKYDIRNVSTRNLRRQLGIVSQEPILFNRTISDNIAYGDNSRLVSMSEIIEAAEKANIHHFITSLPAGYETRLGEKATQLSGGQKQRIAIARALIRNPITLLLDEATSALDAENERIVQDALTRASEGRTTITIAHRLATIIDSDIIYVLNNGQVYESGTHTELIEERGLYYTLYNLQTSAI